MIMSVANTPAFGAKVPLKSAKKWIPRTEYQQKQIERLNAQIGIISRDTDSLYLHGYDDAGRLTRDAREGIAKNESQVESIKAQIDLLKSEIARRFEKEQKEVI